MKTKTITLELSAPTEEILNQAEASLQEMVSSENVGAIGIVVLKDSHDTSFTARKILKSKIKEFKKVNSIQ